MEPPEPAHVLVLDAISGLSRDADEAEGRPPVPDPSAPRAIYTRDLVSHADPSRTNCVGPGATVAHHEADLASGDRSVLEPRPIRNVHEADTVSHGTEHFSIMGG